MSKTNCNENLDLVDSRINLVRDIVEEVFKKDKDYLIFELSRKLSGLSITSDEEKLEVEDGGEWLQIDSLSKLRAEVGGRFQTLKARWLDAGFPLKAKKGQKIPEYELIQEGWVELEGWILKQGFEARYRPSESEYLFEIRKLS